MRRPQGLPLEPQYIGSPFHPRSLSLSPSSPFHYLHRFLYGMFLPKSREQTWLHGSVLLMLSCGCCDYGWYDHTMVMVPPLPSPDWLLLCVLRHRISLNKITCSPEALFLGQQSLLFFQFIYDAPQITKFLFCDLQCWCSRTYLEVNHFPIHPPSLLSLGFFSRFHKLLYQESIIFLVSCRIHPFLFLVFLFIMFYQ